MVPAGSDRQSYIYVFIAALFKSVRVFVPEEMVSIWPQLYYSFCSKSRWYCLVLSSIVIISFFEHFFEQYFETDIVEK